MWRVDGIKVPFLALVAAFGCCGCPARSTSQEVPAAAAVPAGRWEITVAKDGKLIVRQNGATVVESLYLFWGKSWKYAASRFEVLPAEGDVARFTGTVADLGLTILGTISHPTPESIRIEYRTHATRPLDSIIGGGIEWRCRLDSPSFATKPPAPVLLDRNTGWTWPAAPGQDLAVRFSEPITSVSFDRGQKSTIRTMFIGSTLRPGVSSFSMTVQLPPGGRSVRPVEERYGPAETSRWYRGALRWDASPVDLASLFADERPAGRHGFVTAKGDQLVFADGTPARFWGGNLAAYALFVDKPSIARQARRIAQLGYNLMRIHHHDSTRWVRPTVVDRGRMDSRHLDPAAMDRIDWWIKCLKEEGIYVWLDLHVGRQFKAGDGISPGFDEILRAQGEAKGFNYLNPSVQGLMREFNAAYLGHVNRYTGLAYKDDPAVMGLLITNENDMTQHGHFALPDKNNPAHNAIFMSAARDFAAASGLSADQVWRTWEPGASKVFLNELEHRFNQPILGDLRRLGVRVPVATTNFWGGDGLSSLPALADGGVIDVHSYGASEAFNVNPRYEANYIAWIAAAQVSGMPLTITEWNVAYPAADRFTSPLYVASIASLQGWDAPMIYNYSQAGSFKPSRSDTWSTAYDPALTGMLPAAAVAFRRGHVSPARKSFRLELGRDAFFKGWTPENSATIRTLAELSRLEIGLPESKELPWVRKSAPPRGAAIVNDPNRDFIPAGQGFVQSDTGELRRDWEQGIQTIDTPRTQAAAGWVGGREIRLKDVSFDLRTRKAAVAVTSLDDRPIASSTRILISAMARVVASPGENMPYLSEPVVGSIAVRSTAGELDLVSLSPDGLETAEPRPTGRDGVVTIRLPSTRGTHWFLLKRRPAHSPGAAPKQAVRPGVPR